MDIAIKNYAVINIAGVDIWITESIVNAWIIMLVLTALSLVVRLMIGRFKDLPKGFQNIIELMVEAFDGFVRSTAGDKLMGLGNWYFMLFSFILLSNIAGIFGLTPPSADWAMTFACALSTFAIIQIVAFKFQKFGYLKSFIEPFVLFLPLNILGEISRPIALSFRLFGNVLAGSIMLSLIYNIAPLILKLLLPAAMHIYFDLVSGILQTYIFVILSLSFIGAAAVSNDKEEA